MNQRNLKPLTADQVETCEGIGFVNRESGEGINLIAELAAIPELNTARWEGKVTITNRRERVGRPVIVVFQDGFPVQVKG